MDRGVWKLAIHVPEPWAGFEILWVSALAYPNLFGTKGLVVVVDYYTGAARDANKSSLSKLDFALLLFALET